MNTNIDSLLTVKNYAMRERVTPSYIYKLAKENRLKFVVIDGVKFIDKSKFPTIPERK